MENMHVKLPFRELHDGENLYDDIDLLTTKIVDAQYEKRKGFENNPDYCAIPREFSSLEIIKMSSEPLINYDDETDNMYAINLQIIGLQHVAYPLGISFDMAVAINRALTTSYYIRNTELDFEEGANHLTNKASCQSKLRVVGGRADGFLVFGSSGCGKSVALARCCAMYPMAIRHRLPQCEYIQIPIVRVTAFKNDLSDVYRSIALRLDYILDTPNYHVSKIKRSTLGEAGQTLSGWIEKYHIGLIIIDEIQFLNFGNKKSSFENIVTIAAETGVAFGMIGNNEILKPVDSMDRLLQRIIKTRIYADSKSKFYKDLFISALEDLWEYQWKGYTPLTKEIKNELLYQSNYNIALLKAIIFTVQYKYVNSKEDNTLDVSFIRKSTGNAFEQLRKLIAQNTPASEAEMKALLSQTYESFQQVVMKTVNDLKNATLYLNHSTREKSRAVNSLLDTLDGYSEDEIRHAVDCVTNSSKRTDLPAKTIVSMALDYLGRHKATG